jgi:hypothetical protein
VKRFALCYAAYLALALATGKSFAAPRDRCGSEGVWCGPIVPVSLAPVTRSYFNVSMGAEAWQSEFAGSNYLAALATALRISAFSPYIQLMAKPGIGTENYENTHFLAGTGMRAYLPVMDGRFSYGIGMFAELRLREHFWLAYAMPIELSGVVYRKNGLEIEIFAGARRAFAGRLINSFLLDPNGYENEAAEDNLRRARHEDAWHGFVRIMISRRID